MRVASVVLVLLLYGCTTQSVDPSYYLMRPGQDLPSGKLSASSEFSLGNVAVASYLDQPGIMLETDDGELHAARQSLWAEPVSESVRDILFVEIARAKGEELLPSKLIKGATVVEIRIDELHGTRDGGAKLLAYWWLQRDGKVLAIHRFSQTRALAADGYNALVKAEEALLTEFAQQIAASLTTPANSP